jgi:hypothetical protein
MPNDLSRAAAIMGTAILAFALPTVLNTAAASGAPLPGFCVPDRSVDGVCTARLSSVTTNAVDGTITGSPVGGGTAVTLAGQGDAYLKSAGFEATPPDTVQRWDATIDQVNNLAVDQSDPNWYGNAKSRAFLPRTLNELASQFPADIVVVRFTADDAQPGSFRLVSIQPTAQ